MIVEHNLEKWEPAFPRQTRLRVCREEKSLPTAHHIQVFFLDNALFEQHADAIVAAPDGMTAAHELIRFDEQDEGLRQAEGIGDVKPRAT
jgi:hypothetical protein